jgi:zinc transporter ZupT
MMIAVAIGVHNFSEGLAIGVSAQAGEVALATGPLGAQGYLIVRELV